ncbi:hypothetical protein [Treponema pedis]|nr:hypothetical protein [Treponema pedis]QSI04590.1 hypothetical protein DYQ05_06400 [Treponema pedis]
MLSEKVKNYLIETGLYDETEDTNYQKVMLDLGIKLDAAFAQFNLYTNAVTFSGQAYDIYNVCWFAINSTYSEQIENMQSALNLPEEYIPLDSFEAEGGFFYNLKTGEVLELELGQKLIDFQNGQLQPQWKDFNSFLEWFFELE